jgi:hypothetical protein
MKRTLKNVLLFGFGVSVGATAIIMSLFELIGNYTYLVLVILFFTSLAWIIIEDIKKS